MTDDVTTQRTRRRTLQTLGTGAVLALAGCLDSEDTDDPGENETNANKTQQPDSTDQPDDGADETDTLGPADLESRAREFVELLDAGEYETAYDLVAERFAEQIPPAQMEQVWSRQIGIYGDLETVRSAEYRGERDDGLATVLIRAELTDRAVTFEYAFSEGEIAEFLATPASEWTRPHYVDPAAFSERELTLDAPGDCELGATLSVPNSSENRSGVVLVHGSGDQDRDETAGPNKTFRELAQGLASRGVAVLRYDQRPLACDVDRTEATLDALVTDDAVTAVERLRAVDRVGEVVVAGHSLGGRVAPRIAQRADAAGMVMLAPLAEPIHEAIVRQTRHVLTLDGELSATDEQALAETEALAEQLRTLDIGEDETLNLGGGARGRPFWRTLQEYDHTATAASLDVPTLLVQGGRDYLVTTEDDLPLWREAIGGDPQTEIVVFEDLNHRFQPGSGPSRPREWTTPENPVAKRVVDQIAAFLSNEL
ncbi:alpha/beta hydrolase [Halovenus halobia]|uniref:alpha/beta hydrolase n=1 Tax=Halovenus halobia TaxID=3396622 RepID=UPI003F555754